MNNILLNVATLDLGLSVWVMGFRGENGDKVHCANGVVELKDGEKVVAFGAAFACDGDGMQAGNGGYYRGYGSILAVKGSECEEAALDAAITCEVCRSNMKLAPITQSKAAAATIAAKKAADAARREAAKLTTKRAELENAISRLEAENAAIDLLLATPTEKIVAEKIEKFAAEYGYDAETLAKMYAYEAETGRDAENVNDEKRRKANYRKHNLATISQKRKKLAAL